jgi:hypothetical protein
VPGHDHLQLVAHSPKICQEKGVHRRGATTKTIGEQGCIRRCTDEWILIEEGCVVSRGFCDQKIPVYISRRPVISSRFPTGINVAATTAILI